MNYKKIMFVFGASALFLAACGDEEKTADVEIEAKKRSRRNR